MKLMLFILSHFTLVGVAYANLTYCQDYMTNGAFNPVFYPDLWSMDSDGKFKKNSDFLTNEEFKQQGTIDEKKDRIVLTKKFISSVPITKTEIELNSDGKIIKVSSFQVSKEPPLESTLFSSYEFHYSNNNCYPYEEWDENSGTIFNTEFCREAKPILQTHFKNKKQKNSKNSKNSKNEDSDDNDKADVNLKLFESLSDLIKKHNVKDKTGKPYLETLDFRAKKQNEAPSSIVLEKTLMMSKVCKEMDGVSRAINDPSLFKTLHPQ